MTNRRVVAAVLTAASIFAGARAGLHWRTAQGMTACWNTYGSAINGLANRHKVSQSLILAVVWQESGCNPNAARFEPHVYHWPLVVKLADGHEAERRFLASSYGLMQVLGVTARGMGYYGAPWEFKVRSLAYGVRYLHGNYNQWGSWNHAIASYNGGDGAVRRYFRIGSYGKTVDRYVRTVHALRSRYAIAIVQAWVKSVGAQDH